MHVHNPWLQSGMKEGWVWLTPWTHLAAHFAWPPTYVRAYTCRHSHSASTHLCMYKICCKWSVEMQAVYDDIAKRELYNITLQVWLLTTIAIWPHASLCVQSSNTNRIILTHTWQNGLARCSPQCFPSGDGRRPTHYPSQLKHRSACTWRRSRWVHKVSYHFSKPVFEGIDYVNLVAQV